LFKQPLHLASRKNRIYNRKHSLTQPLTKITSYILKRIAFTTSRASKIKTRAKEVLLSISTLRNILEYYKCWRLNWKEIEKEILHSTIFSCISPLWYCYVTMTDITFLSFISPRHDHVILFYLYTLLLSIIPWSPNWLPFTLNMV